jgi:probable rRNA maturation factor
MDANPDPAAELLIRYRGAAVDWKTFRQFISRMARELTGIPFTVAIVSDKAIRRLNLNFRKKDAATDVLSFPSEAAKSRQTTGARHDDGLGDVVISAPTAARSAREHGWSLDQELRALALHGVLHLMGYDHETDRGQMARAERNWGRRLRLPQTLIARRYRKARRQPL